jgi:predicted enzyme related to lactoylglutathione lyase
MADKTVRGRFVWHDLITSDTAAAQAFYTKTLGWRTQAWEQNPSYSMFVAGSGPLGGSEAVGSGDKPHWIAYIGTPDIDATVQKATSLGATVVKPVQSLPNGGRFAFLTDPQGAKFGVYSSAEPPGPHTAPKRGEYSWHELLTTDFQAGFDFYSTLFGWDKMQSMDMGQMGTYLIFGRDGMQMGGIMNKPKEVPGGSAWLGYVRVRDVNQIVKKVKSAGGTLINGPMEVPGGDWIAQFVDPQGVAFAVHALKADMTPAAPAQPAAAQPAEAPPAAAPAASAPAEKPAAKPAAKPAKAPAKKAAPKKAAAKKAPAKKKAAAKKAAPKKKKAAAKAAKRPAKKAAAKGKVKSKGKKKDKKKDKKKNKKARKGK